MTQIQLADVELSYADRGRGAPVLLLHGGAGPALVSSLAERLSSDHRVIVPTHPGFLGTPRPTWLDRVDDLAFLYADLIDALELTNVLVVGNSLGGWIAAEMALCTPQKLAGVVLVNAAGIEVPGHPIADISQMPPQEIAKLSFHDPSRFTPPPATPEVRAAMAANAATMAAITNGGRFSDPRLQRRLHRATTPALVVWGESDKIVDLEYGRAYAKALPHARFELVPGAGHMPQLEQLDKTLALVSEFSRSVQKV
jgi:pimeloyl-ACP methyl ester carboxylesterase